MQICYCKQKGYKGCILGFLVLFDCVVFCQAALIIIFVRFYLANNQPLTTNKQQQTTVYVVYSVGVGSNSCYVGLVSCFVESRKDKKEG